MKFNNDADGEMQGYLPETRKTKLVKRRDATGSSLLAALFGISILLLFLLFAFQTGLGLYNRSLIQSMAFDAVRRVAEDDAADTSEADRELRTHLGITGSRMQTDWQLTTESVALHVRAPLPTFLGSDFVPAITTFDKSFVVRRETWR